MTGDALMMIDARKHRHILVELIHLILTVVDHRNLLAAIIDIVDLKWRRTSQIVLLSGDEVRCVGAVHSHVSIEVARLTESQQAQFALIGFFATVCRAREEIDYEILM